MTTTATTSGKSTTRVDRSKWVRFALLVMAGGTIYKLANLKDAFYAANVKVAMKLGQVRGVVLLLGEQRGLQIAEYAPRLIKQTVVGYGNAEKHQVQQMVKVLLKLKTVPTPHDAADALAIRSVVTEMPPDFSRLIPSYASETCEPGTMSSRPSGQRTHALCPPS